MPKKTDRVLTVKAPALFHRLDLLDRLLLSLPELERRDLHIDLTPVERWNPGTIIGTLVVVQYLRELQQKNHLPYVSVSYGGPGQASALASLLGFSQMLGELFGAAPTTSRARVNAAPIIPAQRFSTSADVERLANEMAEVFQTQLIGLSFLLQPCHIVFSELADNVLHHAESGSGFVSAARIRHRERSGRAVDMVEIAVGDAGIGIPAAIRRNPALQPESDSSAIRLALQEGVSGLSDSYRGYGLWHVGQEIVRKAQQRSMVLRSGSGLVRLRGDGRLRRAEYKHFPGTLAHVMIPYGAPSKRGIKQR
jgi:anti-sigma regulatory factor (Ser/Thr protein kinase)